MLGSNATVGGNYTNLFIVDIFDVTNGQWNSTSTGAGALGQARSGLVAAAGGSKIVFAGGMCVLFDPSFWCTDRACSNSTGVSAFVDIYDINLQQWNSSSTGAGQLSVARYALAAAAAGDVLVFAGG